jgi:putative oxidoreductase
VGTYLKYLYSSSVKNHHFALLILRLTIGFIFMIEGLKKLLKGEEEILWVGQQMANLGITFWPYFWGLAAVLSELVGGLFLVFGFLTRPAALLMSFTMFVAIIYHLNSKDPFGYWAYPLLALIVFVVFIIVGSSKYSLDCLIAKRMSR